MSYSPIHCVNSVVWQDYLDNLVKKNVKNHVVAISKKKTYYAGIQLNNIFNISIALISFSLYYLVVHTLDRVIYNKLLYKIKFFIFFNPPKPYDFISSPLQSNVWGEVFFSLVHTTTANINEISLGISHLMNALVDVQSLKYVYLDQNSDTSQVLRCLHSINVPGNTEYLEHSWEQHESSIIKSITKLKVEQFNRLILEANGGVQPDDIRINQSGFVEAITLENGDWTKAKVKILFKHEGYMTSVPNKVYPWK